MCLTARFHLYETHNILKTLVLNDMKDIPVKIQ